MKSSRNRSPPFNPVVAEVDAIFDQFAAFAAEFFILDFQSPRQIIGQRIERRAYPAAFSVVGYAQLDIVSTVCASLVGKDTGSEGRHS